MNVFQRNEINLSSVKVVPVFFFLKERSEQLRRYLTSFQLDLLLYVRNDGLILNEDLVPILMHLYTKIEPQDIVPGLDLNGNHASENRRFYSFRIASTLYRVWQICISLQLTTPWEKQLKLNMVKHMWNFNQECVAAERLDPHCVKFTFKTRTIPNNIWEMDSPSTAIFLLRFLISLPIKVQLPSNIENVTAQIKYICELFKSQRVDTVDGECASWRVSRRYKGGESLNRQSHLSDDKREKQLLKNYNKSSNKVDDNHDNLVTTNLESPVEDDPNNFVQNSDFHSNQGKSLLLKEADDQDPTVALESLGGEQDDGEQLIERANDIYDPNNLQPATSEVSEDRRNEILKRKHITPIRGNIHKKILKENHITPISEDRRNKILKRKHLTPIKEIPLNKRTKILESGESDEDHGHLKETELHQRIEDLNTKLLTTTHDFELGELVNKLLTEEEEEEEL